MKQQANYWHIRLPYLTLSHLHIQLEMGQAMQSQGQMLQRPVEYEDGEGNSKSLEKKNNKMLHIWYIMVHEPIIWLSLAF